MKYTIAALLLFILVITGGCSRDNNNNMYGNCRQFILPFEQADELAIKKKIEAGSASLGIIPHGSTYHDIEILLKKLAESLTNGPCHIIAEANCVMCIDTGTPMSEISMSFPSDNITKHLAIDLYTREGNLIEFVGVHQ